MPLFVQISLAVLPELMKIFWQAYKDAKSGKRSVEQITKTIRDVEYAFKNPNKLSGSKTVSDLFNNLLQ